MDRRIRGAGSPFILDNFEENRPAAVLNTMNITAESVKQLRERTGAGMMECKRALVDTSGDLDAAAELMRKTGLAKADKKAARGGAEGTVAVERAGNSAVLVEINSETDFVARSDEFQAFARAVARTALESSASDVNALLAQKHGAATLDEERRALIAKIGENISVRRFVRVTAAGALGAYIFWTLLLEFTHGNLGNDLILAEGFRRTFLCGAIVAAIALVLAIILREEPLQTTRPGQRRMASSGGQTA